MECAVHLYEPRRIWSPGSKNHACNGGRGADLDRNKHALTPLRECQMERQTCYYRRKVRDMVETSHTPSVQKLLHPYTFLALLTHSHPLTTLLIHDYPYGVTRFPGSIS